MAAARPRRAVALFLLILTLVVFLRLVSAAEGASLGRPERPLPEAGRLPAPAPISLQVEEAGDLLVGGGTAHRTLVVRGLRAWSGGLQVNWEARVGGSVTASGRRSISARQGGAARVILSVPLPEVDRPVGVELRVEVTDAGRPAGEAAFPFTLYPAGRGEAIARLLSRARVALYDPEGRAGRALRALGILPEEFASFQGLALYEGDLIVVGPGGFARGREGLGPALAARARSGMRALILEQPTLPGTLSEDLRLWPSFSRSRENAVVLAPAHPLLLGLSRDEGTGFFGASPAWIRPLLPPTRGNFRIIAQERLRSGPSWQEGVRVLEFAIGDGVVLMAQSSLCSDYGRDPRARILLANALAYLLGERPGLKRTFLYGRAVEDLPPCLARLAPRLTAARDGLDKAEVLLVPGDWQAPRLAAASDLPPLADVARFQREGGTVVLLNPQTLVADYLERIAGAPVHFETPARDAPPPGAPPALLQGIAPEDLDLLHRPGRPELRLRPAPGPDGIEALLLVPGIALYRVGRGSLVALALPEADTCAAPRTSSLLARLFTNLGIPLDQPPGIDPAAISLLDE